MKKQIISTLIFLIAINFTIMAQKFSVESQAKLPWLDSLMAKGKIANNTVNDIKSYIYKENVVYLVNYSSGCCDQYSAVLLDETGNTICHPFGGISGKGDMQCTDFLNDRKVEKQIWVNENILIVSDKKERSFKMEKSTN
jgi:hypothetical protein